MHKEGIRSRLWRSPESQSLGLHVERWLAVLCEKRLIKGRESCRRDNNLALLAVCQKEMPSWTVIPGEKWRMRKRRCDAFSVHIFVRLLLRRLIRLFECLVGGRRDFSCARRNHACLDDELHERAWCDMALAMDFEERALDFQ